MNHGKVPGRVVFRSEAHPGRCCFCVACLRGAAWKEGQVLEQAAATSLLDHTNLVKNILALVSPDSAEKNPKCVEMNVRIKFCISINVKLKGIKIRKHR